MARLAAAGPSTWRVVREDEVIEVEAYYLDVHDGGSLIFEDEKHFPVEGYGSGRWVSFKRINGSSQAN